MTTNNLMLVIRATNDAAKVLASVQDQLGLIVEAAQAANEGDGADRGDGGLSCRGMG